MPNIYAAGDCAAVKGKLLQLWEPARMQARVVAATIQGRGDRFGDPERSEALGYLCHNQRVPLGLQLERAVEGADQVRHDQQLREGE